MREKEIVLNRTREVLQQAEDLYNINLSKVYVFFDLSGTAAGQAGVLDDIHYIRFNKDMLSREAFNHIYTECIPHEVAHIVCFINPTLGIGHNPGWSTVCHSLGGKGVIRHSEDVVYGKGYTYEYVSTTGCKLRVSQQIHSRVSKGQVYTFRRDQGSIDSTCRWRIVGKQGKTL